MNSNDECICFDLREINRLEIGIAVLKFFSLSFSGYSMGNSTSRLYSALAKTLSSSVITKHQDYLEQTDPEFLDPIDPKDLLEECQIVLQNRPARLQRDFVDLRASCVRNHQPIRVMQWNILAQGTILIEKLCLSLVK